MSGLGNCGDGPSSSPHDAGTHGTASLPYPGMNTASSPHDAGTHGTASLPCAGATNPRGRSAHISNRIGDRQLPDSDPRMQLLQAFKLNDLQLFRYLLRGVDPYGYTIVDPNHMYGHPWNATCLEMACDETDRSGFVRVLLKSGSDPNQMSPFSDRGPIHSVAEKSCVESMRFLLDHNSIDINLQDGSRNSALHLLAKQKTDAALECVKLLLDNVDVDVNLKDRVGHTALDVAINSGSKEMVQTMLDICGKRLNIDTPRRLDRQTTRTVLMDTFKDIKQLPGMEQANTSVMEFKQVLFSHLHKQECDVFIAELERNEVNIFEVINKNDGWNTYLQYATKHNLHKVVRRLLELNADPNVVTTTDKRPPLVIACIQRDHVTVDHLLLELGVAININAADGKGNTALHWAARNRDLGMIVKLVNHGADYHVGNNFDEPALSSVLVDDILDRCLRCNDSYPDADDYELLFDYSVLVAHEMDVASSDRNDVDPEEERCSVETRLKPLPEMEFLSIMCRLRNYEGTLKHPIVSSFLNMKWQRFIYLFYTNLIFDLLFIMSLGHHLTSEGFVSLRNICLITFIILNVLKETLKLCYLPLKLYVKDYENALNWILLTSACVSICRYVIPYDLTHVFLVSVFLVAFRAVLIIGRLPRLSKYNEMLKTILVHSLTLLTCFSVFLLAFAWCFYSASASRSLYHTILMMAGGTVLPDALPNTSLPERYRYEPEARLIYVILFALTIPIVLVNTLIGLAVHSTFNVQSKADELAIKSKINHVYDIEKALMYFHGLLDNCRFTKKSLSTHYGMHKAITYWLETCIIFTRVSPSEKIIRIAPNKHNFIILPKNVMCDANLKIHNGIIGEAMRVISRRNQNKIQTLMK